MKAMQRSLCLVLILLVLGAPAALAAEEPSVAAAACILGDPDSGEILFEMNADATRAPASLTKIMTALLAVEAIEAGGHTADELVTAGADCLAGLDEDSSTADIQPGEQMTLLDLIYCAMLSSANESCNILAAHLAGSVDAFVQQMNARAQELGCTGTHFVNPNGLSAEGHVSTARDLFRIGSEAMRHPLFAEVCGTCDYEVPATNLHEARWLENSNALLNADSMYGADYVYDGCVGLKTGYTGSAGYCLVSEVCRDGLSYMAVVLGCDGVNNGGEGYGSFSESVKLYDWALTHYEKRVVLSQDEPVCTVKLKHGWPRTAELYPAEDVFLRVSTDAAAEPVIRCETAEDGVIPPLEAGTELGTVTISLGSTESTETLVLREHVMRSMFSYGLFWAALALVIVAAFVVVGDVRAKKKKKARRARHEAAAKGQHDETVLDRTQL